jgi:hypothetical protein
MSSPALLPSSAYDTAPLRKYREEHPGTVPVALPESLQPEKGALLRLFALYPHEDVALALMDEGFGSAAEIARRGEGAFVRDVEEPLARLKTEPGGTELARRIHQRATALHTQTLLAAATFVETPAVDSPALQHAAGLPSFQAALPTYRALFGPLHAQDCSDCESVLSPAAYFTDLMRVIDQQVTQPSQGRQDPALSLQARRPDLWQLELGCGTTEAEVPYLSIANQVMEAKLAYELEAPPEPTLATAQYPFRAPYNLKLEQLRAYLEQLGTSLAELYATLGAPATDTAHEALGLSPEQAGLITTASATDASVSQTYGLYAEESPADLASVSLFLRKTGLPAEKLPELVYQGLRHEPVATSYFPTLNDNVGISVPNSSSLQVTGDQTIELWVRFAATNNNVSVIDKAYGGEVAITLGTDGLHYYYGQTGTDSDNGPSPAYVDYLFLSSVEANTWIHVAVVRDMEARTLQAYVNGVPVSTQASASIPCVASTNPFRIGTGYWATHCETWISEVRYWAVARSTEEIQANLYRRLTGKEPGLAGYWPLDEGSGSTARDRSPWGNMGTVLSNTSWTGSQGLRFQGPEPLEALFLNSNLSGGFLQIAPASAEPAAPARLEVVPASGGTPSAPGDASWDLLQRFIRLAEQLGWSFAELDWALKSLGGTNGQITDALLGQLAELKRLRQSTGLPIDTLCALWADLKTIGMGDTGASQALFDRVFNQPQPLWSTGGLQAPPPYHPSYSGNPLYRDTVQSWDPEGTEGADVRLRASLQSALQLKTSELSALTRYLLAQGAFTNTASPPAPLTAAPIPLTVENLGQLYRYATLCRVTGLRPDGLIALLELCGVGEIEGPKQVLALSQAAAWMREARLSPARAALLCAGGKALTDEDVQPLLQALEGAAASVLLTPASFVQDGVTSDQSAQVFQTLTQEGFISPEGLVLQERPLRYTPLEGCLGDLFSEAAERGVDPVAGVERVLAQALAQQTQLVLQQGAAWAARDAGAAAAALHLAVASQPSHLAFNSNGSTYTQYVEVPASPAFSPAAFTFTCWALATPPSNKNWMTLFEYAGDNWSGYLLYINNEKQLEFFAGNGDSTWQTTTQVGGFPLDRWAHVAVVYTGTTVRLYIDGRLSSTRTLSQPIAPNTTRPFAIGASLRDGPVEYPYAGRIADLRMWDVALSDAEIQAVLAGGPTKPKHLVAAWRLDEGQGSTVWDWTGQGHDGAIQLATGVSAPEWDSERVTPGALLTLPADEAPPAAVMELLRAWRSGLELASSLGLEAVELEGFTSNPLPYGLPGESRWELTLPVLRELWSLHRLAGELKVPVSGLVRYFALPDDFPYISPPSAFPTAPTAKMKALARATGWPPDALLALECALATAWQQADLPASPRAWFNTVEGLGALARAFALGERLGTGIPTLMQLRELAGLPASGGSTVDGSPVSNWHLYEQAATTVAGLYHAQGRKDDAIAGPLQSAWRDVLVRTLLWELGKQFRGLRGPDQLYEFLLIDVQMGPGVRISPLAAGLSSLQLYLQRCVHGLESGAVCTLPPRWWDWMGSYGTWQANRAVFLYPENYVDPALRRFASPLFEALKDALNQGQPSRAHVEQAYTNYLEGLSQIANPRLAGSYSVRMQPAGSTGEAEEKALFLFGRTPTDPSTWYQRSGLLAAPAGKPQEARLRWGAWQSVPLSIQAEEVTLIHAFERLFVFWVEQTEKTISSGDEKQEITTASVMYAFQTAGQGWSQPQTLIDDVVISVRPCSISTGFVTDPAQEMWRRARVLPTRDGAGEITGLLVFYGDLVPASTSIQVPTTLGDSPDAREFTALVEQAQQWAAAVAALNPSGGSASWLIPLIPPVLLGRDFSRTELQGYIDETEAFSYEGALGFWKGAEHLYLRQLQTFSQGLAHSWPIHEGQGNAISDPQGGLNGVVNNLLPSGYGYMVPNTNPIWLASPGVHFADVSVLSMSTEQIAFTDGPRGYEQGLTVSLRVYPKSLPSSGVKLVCSSNGNTTGFSVGFTGTGQLLLECWQASGYHRVTSSAPAVFQNIWNHLVATFSPTNGQIVGYVNGTQVATGSMSGELVPTPQFGLGSCSWNDPSSNYYALNGLLTDVFLWNRALSAGEVAGLQSPGLELASGDLQPGRDRVRNVGNETGWFLFQRAGESYLLLPTQCALPQLTELLSVDLSTPGRAAVTVGAYQPAVGLQEQRYQFVRLSTGAVSQLSDRLMAGGLPELLRLSSQYSTEPTLQGLTLGTGALAPMRRSLDFEGAYGEYFWELFFYAPLLIGDHLEAQLRFDDARRWYQHLFEPAPRTPSGLVSDWPMRELTGTAGSLSVKDQVGAHDGAQSSSGSFSVVDSTFADGYPVRSVRLEQGGSFQVSDTPSLNPTTALTLEGWTLLSVGSTDAWVLAKPGPNSHDYQYALFVTTEGNLTFDLTTTQQTNYGAGCRYPADAAWHHVAGTFDGRTLRLYLDGEQVSSSSLPSGASIGSFGHPLSLGGGGFSGSLLDLRVWSVVRSAEEIREDCANARPHLRYWQFAPFRSASFESLARVLASPDTPAFHVYEVDPFDANALARLRPGSLEKAVLMRFIDTLIQLGDALYSRSTWEAATEAAMCYVLAGDLLGRPPRQLAPNAPRPPRSYQDLASAWPNGVPPFLIELEGALDVEGWGSLDAKQQALAVWQSLADAYFCIPPNARLLQTWGKVADRLYKIRHGLTLDGQPAQLALYAPSVDPARLQAGGGASPASSASPRIPAQRFSALLPTARSVAGNALALGNALLGALERGDAEALAQLQATQQGQLLALTTGVRQSQLAQLQATADSLQAALARAQEQVQTLRVWLAQGLNPSERAGLSQVTKATVLSLVAGGLKLLASVDSLIPNIYGLADGGMEFGQALGFVAGTFETEAGMLHQLAQLNNTMAVFQRRDQDWQLQLGMAERTVQEVQAQLEANQAALAGAQQELTLNQTEIQQNQAIQAFLQSRFTNAALYHWMAGQLSGLYFQTWQLALSLASSAQTALRYELNVTDDFLRPNAWDSLRQGLTAGQALQLSLDQMEQAFTSRNRRPLEIQKTISLLQVAPHAVMQLRASGSCEFALTEALFDRDFPGHYDRKIKSISLSIPALVGPYQNVRATLVQLSNSVVTAPDVDAVKYLMVLDGVSQPPASVRTNWNAQQQIALSTANQDAGVFVLDFNDARYLPFEGTGAVSTWKLSMPKAANPFRFETISDVVIHLGYTAHDGGSTFASQITALDPVKQYQGTRYISLRQLFGTAWHAFLSSFALDFEIAQALFPVNLEPGSLTVCGSQGGLVLVPVLSNPALTDDLPPITLNGYPWNSENRVAQAGTEPIPVTSSPLRWAIEADFGEDSESPLLVDGKINPAKWLDIVLLLPFDGTLDWGVEATPRPRGEGA